jgi:cobalt-zinc-cadmium efflux system membrane fusion protein
LPNAIVFALLAAIFVYGHHHDWKLPRFSTLLNHAPAPPADWCQEHLVPASQCVQCRPELRPKRPEFGFCREHGVAECVLCHPELAQVAGTPKLPTYDVSAALKLIPRPTNNSRSSLHRAVVQLASQETVEKLGLEVDVAHERPMQDVLSAHGRLLFNPTRIAHLSSPLAGTLLLVRKKPGDRVAAGETLLILDAAAVGQAKGRLLEALAQRRLRQANLERLRAAVTAVAARSVREAETALQEAEIAWTRARQELLNLALDVPADLADADEPTPSPEQLIERLRWLGIDAECREELPTGLQSTNLLPLRAPFAGVVLSADAVAGEVVSAASSLLTVADPSQLWLELHVRQERARYVRPGQRVRFETDDGSEHATGEVAWVSPQVDVRTRTVEVRVVVDNAQGRLRANMYAQGEIVLRHEPRAVVVPRAALHWAGDVQLVFVRDRDFFKPGSPKLFYPRQVRPGAEDGQYVEILAGVLPGEVVATVGSSALLGQLLRSNLGADECCPQ